MRPLLGGGFLVEGGFLPFGDKALTVWVIALPSDS